MVLAIDSSTLHLLVFFDTIMLMFLLIQSLDKFPRKIKAACMRLNCSIKCGLINISVILILWVFAMVYLYICAGDIHKLAVPGINENAAEKILRLREKWGMEIKMYLIYFFAIITM